MPNQNQRTKHEILRDKLIKRLQRAEGCASQYQERYSGKEEYFTFHGGYNQGYWEGRAGGLETALDFLIEEYFDED
ncbi:MAG: hypothetical protein Tp178MES00d2C33159851_61 [Prokaryotic dsDNA virus sp.]|nr:MAG: hypothetical protein Tp178MES00d2C33159851_61 [Prokaryotic dsDNA virus sp.]|tara:strand:- start:66003 stop:66230 length:228 start_codon:yes stop_codon:yes gene_type:complete